MKSKKIAVITSHPIQYQTPFFRYFSKQPEIDLLVYFCWNFGVKKTYDEQFGRELIWDIPMIEGYRHKFLRNFSPKPSSKFFGQINPGMLLDLIKNKHDAILIYGWNSLTNWLAFFTALILKTPVFLQGENPLNQELLKNHLKIRIKKIVLGNLFKIIKGFMCIGEENRNFYRYYGVPERKLFFAPYAVDNERFFRQREVLRAKKEEYKKELGIRPEKTVVLFVGKLIEKKRPMDLLRAFQGINSTRKALVFVGDGALRETLERHAKEKNIQDVYFVGFKNQTELGRYYMMADIFVLPSGPGETWGLVVNEAMCFGLPVIVSDVVGCGPDLVRQNENGFVFTLGKIDELATYLNLLASEPATRNSFGRKSLEIIGRYSYEKIAEGILSALRFS